MPCTLLAAYPRYVYSIIIRVSMDQCHIPMCHRAIAWTSDVTYVCVIGLKGLTPTQQVDAQSIYIPWPFPPVWRVANNTKRKQKQWGFYSALLAMTRDPAEFGWHCWSNTAHPSPSSTTYVASQKPSPLLPLPQGCLYKATQWQQQMPIRTASPSFATRSYS